MTLDNNDDLAKDIIAFEEACIDNKFQWNFVILKHLASQNLPNITVEEVVTKLLEYALTNRDVISQVLDIPDMPLFHLENINNAVKELNEAEDINELNSILGDLKIDL